MSLKKVLPTYKPMKAMLPSNLQPMPYLDAKGQALPLMVRPQQPTNDLQGGNFNPGYTPLQNSGFGPMGRPQIQAFNSPQQQVQFNQDPSAYQIRALTSPSRNNMKMMLPMPSIQTISRLKKI